MRKGSKLKKRLRKWCMSFAVLLFVLCAVPVVKAEAKERSSGECDQVCKEWGYDCSEKECELYEASDHQPLRQKLYHQSEQKDDYVPECEELSLCQKRNGYFEEWYTGAES